jgi:hypothetical protein
MPSTVLHEAMDIAHHVAEHAQWHIQLIAAAQLAEIIREHQRDAATAVLRFDDGQHTAHLSEPDLSGDALTAANEMAAYLTDDTWRAWEMVASDEQSLTSSNPTEARLVLDLILARRTIRSLHDFTGATCPRTCIVWRPVEEGGLDLGPCHNCGAKPGHNCRPCCDDPVRLVRL